MKGIRAVGTVRGGAARAPPPVRPPHLGSLGLLPVTVDPLAVIEGPRNGVWTLSSQGASETCRDQTCLFSPAFAYESVTCNKVSCYEACRRRAW